jgi:UDP-3-O-[3-hydroxymyristoyl] glucosamine N-acyltransferase
MSHSDTAIDELNALNAKFFEEMRASAEYRFGYCRSAINTAIWFLENGKVSQALENLQATAILMQDKEPETFEERKLLHDQN